MQNVQDPVFQNYASKVVFQVQKIGWTPRYLNQVIRDRYGKLNYCQLSNQELEDLIAYLKHQ